MERYVVIQFDSSTYQVVDRTEQREICVCADYDETEDAKSNANLIAYLLNNAGKGQA